MNIFIIPLKIKFQKLNRNLRNFQHPWESSLAMKFIVMLKARRSLRNFERNYQQLKFATRQIFSRHVKLRGINGCWMSFHPLQSFLPTEISKTIWGISVDEIVLDGEMWIVQYHLISQSEKDYTTDLIKRQKNALKASTTEKNLLMHIVELEEISAATKKAFHKKSFIIHSRLNAS